VGEEGGKGDCKDTYLPASSVHLEPRPTVDQHPCFHVLTLTVVSACHLKGMAAGHPCIRRTAQEQRDIASHIYSCSLLPPCNSSAAADCHQHLQQHTQLSALGAPA
jgi:hypothetical protein